MKKNISKYPKTFQSASFAAWKNTLMLQKKFAQRLTKQLSDFYEKSVDDSLQYLQYYSTNTTKAMLKMKKVFDYSKKNFPDNKDLINFFHTCMENLITHDRDLKVLASNGDVLRQLKKTAFNSYIGEIKNYTEVKLNPYIPR